MERLGKYKRDIDWLVKKASPSEFADAVVAISGWDEQIKEIKDDRIRLRRKHRKTRYDRGRK